MTGRPRTTGFTLWRNAGQKSVEQESLADAKVSVRQQCMYEGPYRRNLQQINDMRLTDAIHMAGSVYSEC